MSSNGGKKEVSIIEVEKKKRERPRQEYSSEKERWAKAKEKYAAGNTSSKGKRREEKEGNTSETTETTRDGKSTWARRGRQMAGAGSRLFVHHHHVFEAMNVGTDANTIIDSDQEHDTEGVLFIGFECFEECDTILVRRKFISGKYYCCKIFNKYDKSILLKM